MKGGVFEEGDLDAKGNDLAKFGGGAEIFPTGAEVGECKVSGAGKFEARGEDRGVKVDGCAELDLDAKLHGGGGQSAAVEDPAAAFGKAGGEYGEQTLALLIAEALDVERLHA
jgi:hypothetical protein